jgi:hypothetical protein
VRRQQAPERAQAEIFRTATPHRTQLLCQLSDAKLALISLKNRGVLAHQARQTI